MSWLFGGRDGSISERSVGWDRGNSEVGFLGKDQLHGMRVRNGQGHDRMNQERRGKGTVGVIRYGNRAYNTPLFE
jgi:hypothetical protein